MEDCYWLGIGFFIFFRWNKRRHIPFDLFSVNMGMAISLRGKVFTILFLWRRSSKFVISSFRVNGVIRLWLQAYPSSIDVNFASKSLLVATLNLCLAFNSWNSTKKNINGMKFIVQCWFNPIEIKQKIGSVLMIIMKTLLFSFFRARSSLSVRFCFGANVQILLYIPGT